MVSPLCENNPSTGTEVIGIQKIFLAIFVKSGKWF
jgi:hypothetical protein